MRSNSNSYYSLEIYFKTIDIRFPKRGFSLYQADNDSHHKIFKGGEVIKSVNLILKGEVIYGS